MDDIQRQRVGWNSQQSAAIDAAVKAEVTRIRVVGDIIPTVNVGENDKTVAIDRINPLTRAIDDLTTIPLPEISVVFILDKQQVQQPELKRPLALARRAAIEFARIEEAMLLRGLATAPNGYAPEGVPLLPDTDIQRGQDRVRFGGLAGDPRNDARPVGRGPHHVQRLTGGGPDVYGPYIVSAVAEAIGMLVAAGHMGPYHLILGDAMPLLLRSRRMPLRLSSQRTGSIRCWPRPLERSPMLLRTTRACCFSVGGDPR